MSSSASRALGGKTKGIDSRVQKSQKIAKEAGGNCCSIPACQSVCCVEGEKEKEYSRSVSKSGAKKVVGQIELSSPSTASTVWDDSSESSDCTSPVTRGYKGDERMSQLIAAAREVLQKNNPYLLNGWRFCGTPLGCLTSLFQLHNETFNIWSHALPAIWFIYLCVRHAVIDIPAGVPFAWVYFISTLASSVLFVSSASYHTFRCMSPAALWGWLRVDYCGICTQIIGSSLPALHLGFMCMVALRNVYVTIFSMMLALTLAISSGLMPTRVQNKCCQMCGTDDWSVLSMYTLAASVALTCIPFLQWAFTTSSIELLYFGPQIGLMFFFYGGGFVLFTQLVPERFGYSWFNGALNSHAIWHGCVVAAALVMHNNTVQYATWRVENPCVISAPV